MLPKSYQITTKRLKHKQLLLNILKNHLISHVYQLKKEVFNWINFFFQLLPVKGCQNSKIWMIVMILAQVSHQMLFLVWPGSEPKPSRW